MDFEAARRAMIDSQLRPEGVTDGAVLAAMGSIAREDYVPQGARDVAYVDRPIALGDGRAMMPPAALGRLLGALAPRAGERALVVGAASDYSAAILRAIGLEVVATAHLDGGDAGSDAFDLILVDGAVEAIAQGLIDRLAEHGRLGAALRSAGISRLVIGRAAAGRLALRTIADVDVPPLPRDARREAFSFARS